MEGFLIGCAHEAIARALALTDKQAAAVHHTKAVEILSTIDDPEDVEILRSDLASIELVMRKYVEIMCAFAVTAPLRVADRKRGLSLCPALSS